MVLLATLCPTIVGLCTPTITSSLTGMQNLLSCSNEAQESAAQRHRFHIATAQFHTGYSIDPKQSDPIHTLATDWLWLPSLNVEYWPWSHSPPLLLLIAAAEKPHFNQPQMTHSQLEDFLFHFCTLSFVFPIEFFPCFDPTIFKVHFRWVC